MRLTNGKGQTPFACRENPTACYIVDRFPGPPDVGLLLFLIREQLEERGIPVEDIPFEDIRRDISARELCL